MKIYIKKSSCSNKLELPPLKKEALKVALFKGNVPINRDKGF
jgi:hypothetical protein